MGHNEAVRMVRPALDNIPYCPVPAEYAIRRFRAGDDLTWRLIHLAADKYNDITPELFVQQYGTDATLHEERVFFLDHSRSGRTVGAAAAWWEDGSGGVNWGMVHWVAILPEYQGLGLSKALLAAVCCRLRELGYARARLSTSSGRIPAINLYRSFGFEPEVRSAGDWKTWKSIESHLRLGLGHRFPTECPTEQGPKPRP